MSKDYDQQKDQIWKTIVILDQCFSTFFSTRNPFDQQKLLRNPFDQQKLLRNPFATQKKFAEPLKF